jgi:hypothetical protein
LVTLGRKDRSGELVAGGKKTLKWILYRYGRDKQTALNWLTRGDNGRIL